MSELEFQKTSIPLINCSQGKVDMQELDKGPSPRPPDSSVRILLNATLRCNPITLGAVRQD
jgi:hypothetical protein